MFNIPGISKEELERAKKAATEDMLKDDNRKSKNKRSRKVIRKVSTNS